MPGPRRRDDAPDSFVQEVTLRVTLLLEAPGPAEARVQVEGMELADIAEEADFGDFAAGVHVIAAETVPGDQVRHRLQAIGGPIDAFGDLPPTAERPLDPDAAIASLQARQGWSPERLLELAGDFLREHGLMGALAAHLRERAAETPSPSP